MIVNSGDIIFFKEKCGCWEKNDCLYILKIKKRYDDSYNNIIIWTSRDKIHQWQVLEERLISWRRKRIIEIIKVRK